MPQRTAALGALQGGLGAEVEVRSSPPLIVSQRRGLRECVPGDGITSAGVDSRNGTAEGLRGES